MISPEFCAAMLRFNRWQNHLLIRAAEGMTPTQRQKSRPALALSLEDLLQLRLLEDLTWMARLGAGAPLREVLASDTAFGWDMWRRERYTADARMVLWAERLSAAELEGELWWYAAALKRSQSRPKALCIMHLFEAQSRDRGQAIAALRAEGCGDEFGDLLSVPEDLDWM